MATPPYIQRSPSYQTHRWINQASISGDAYSSTFAAPHPHPTNIAPISFPGATHHQQTTTTYSTPPQQYYSRSAATVRTTGTPSLTSPMTSMTQKYQPIDCSAAVVGSSFSLNMNPMYSPQNVPTYEAPIEVKVHPARYINWWHDMTTKVRV